MTDVRILDYSFRHVKIRTKEMVTENNALQRNYGLDNLKLLLSIIIVILHVMVPYTRIGIPWYFEPGLSEETLSLNPIIIFSRNCGMAIFFMISGYFVPISYDKQGFKTFLWKKTKRLLIPAFAVWAICILCTPYPMYHIWFLQWLFLFCLAYALFRLITKWRIKEGKKLELTITLLGGIFLVMCFFTLIIRQKYYINQFVLLFNLFSFEPAKMAQYVLVFYFGVLARRFDWFIPKSKKLVVEVIVVFILTYIIKEIRITEENYIGSRLATILETSFCLFESLLIIWIFNIFINKSNHFVESIAENSMGIYLFHLPILYYVQTYTKMWEIYFPLKLVLIIVVVSAAAFLISFLLRKFKFFRNFL